MLPSLELFFVAHISPFDTVLPTLSSSTRSEIVVRAVRIDQ